MTAFPATTFPLDGRATGGNKGTAGFAKIVDENMIVIAQKMCVKIPANFTFAK